MTPQQTGADTSFAPHQGVYVPCPGARLYGEVIQVVPARQRCWVRPCAYVLLPSDDVAPPQGQVYDLRQGPDVIWPLGRFQAALDTEWLAMLHQLHHTPYLCDRPQANQILRQVLAGETPSCRWPQTPLPRSAIVPYQAPLPPAKSSRDDSPTR
jgi:hypothetical protein